MKAVLFREGYIRYGVVKALGRLLPKVAVSPFGMVALRELSPFPLPSPRWVKVRPRFSGICGSDLSVITARSSLFLSPLTSTPFVFGHEVVGDVLSVGEAVTKVTVGDRVVLEPALNCFVRELTPPCPRCTEGRYACCERLTEGVTGAGVQTGYCRATGGGWSEEFVAHEGQLLPVPDGLPDEVAVLVEPFGCALHAVLRGLEGMESPETVLVIGCGTMGLLTIAAWRSVEKALGRPSGHLIAVAKYPHQREWAKRLGADVVVPSGLKGYEALAHQTGAKLFRPELGKPTVVGGADLVFECVGSQGSLDDAVRWVRANGVVVVVGMPAEPKVCWASVWFKEARVVGAYAYGIERWQGQRVRTFELALQLLPSLVPTLSGFVTHRFPLNRWREAIMTALYAGRKGAIKVVLYP